MKTRNVWSQEQGACWVCGFKGSTVNPLETHEIARGVHRAAAVKEPAAWVRACRRCHSTILASMPIETQLAYKAIFDTAFYDREKVNELRRRAKNAVSEREVLTELVAIVFSRGFR